MPHYTQKEKRIKLAEACGWTDVGEFHNGLIGTHRAPDGILSRNCIPDYFNDLNATNAIEKDLPLELIAQYHDLLVSSTGFSFDDSQLKEEALVEWRHRLCCASAEQRAEALGKILKLW